MQFALLKNKILHLHHIQIDFLKKEMKKIETLYLIVQLHSPIFSSMPSNQTNVNFQGKF